MADIPEGWKDFEGGAQDESMCDDGTPMSISQLDINASLSCANDVWTLDLQVNGGVPPFTWVATSGKIVVTGPRTAQIRIHSAVGPVVFKGYAGHIDNPDPGIPNCNDAVFKYAYVRLGKGLLDKGIFENCRHHCNYLAYDCSGNVAFGDTTCGDQFFIIEPFDCPFSEVPSGTPPRAPDYGTPGDCLGPCRNADLVDFTYPPVSYFDGISPGGDYAECGQGMPETLVPAEPNYLAAESPIQDTRHPNAIAAGCSPCALVQGIDIIVTAVDSLENAAFIVLHVA